MQQENSTNINILPPKLLFVPHQQPQGEFSDRVGQEDKEQKQEQQQKHLADQQKGKNKIKQQDELIPCQKCGYPQTLEDLDSHPDQCKYQDIQCKKCQKIIPLALMGHHRLECSVSNDLSYKNNVGKKKYEFQTYVKPQILFGQQKQKPIFKRHSQSRRKLQELQQRIQLRKFNLQQYESGLKAKGLTLETISTFPLSKYTSDKNEDKSCVICQSSFKFQEEIITLPCFHMFHPECVYVWFEQKSNCPTCKLNLNVKHQNGKDCCQKFEWMHT